MAPWGLLALLLLVPRENRDRRAWLIMIPVAVIFLLWRIPASVLPLSGFESEQFGIALTSLATAWAAVWLLGNWLAGRGWLETYFWVVLVMAGAGGLAYAGSFGSFVTNQLVGVMTTFAVSAVALSVAMTLSRFCCRGSYSPGRFMGWLALWIFVVPVPLVAAIVIPSWLASGAPPLVMLIPLLIFPVMMGVGSYLLNVPFMLVAFNCSFYAKRFENVVLRRDVDFQSWGTGSPFLGITPVSTDPTDKPVAPEDVVGRWQFYLDEMAKTVSIDFRPDGTFIETIAANHGEVAEHTGGTWHLDGPKVRLAGYVTAGDGTRQPRTWWMVDTPSGLALFGGDGKGPESFFAMTPARYSHAQPAT